MTMANIGPEETPLTITIPFEAFIDAQKAIYSGREYAQMCLTEHDATLGRTTIKNRVWAENMERDIRQMDHALERLKTTLST